MSDEFNILMAGLGGQGVISAGHMLSRAALKDGLNFRTFGSYGMAQRGGSVYLHFRIGDVHLPRIMEGSCDLLVGLELMEGLRNAHFVNPSGLIIIDERLILPPGTHGQDIDPERMIGMLRKRFPNLFVLSIDRKLEGDAKRGLNVAMLGAAFATGMVPISIESMKDSIPAYTPKRMEQNLRAFELGYREFEHVAKVHKVER